MKGFVEYLAAAACLMSVSCGLTESTEVKRPQARRLNYPVVVESTNAKRLRSETAWRLWLERNRAPTIAPDLDPALGVPRSLPPELVQKISITEKPESLSSDGVRQALRQFIGQTIRLLAGDPQERGLSLGDLSLVSLSDDGTFYRATYRQVNFAFSVAKGYGELKVTVTKQGALLQLASRLLPIVEMPSAPTADVGKIIAGLVGRVFRYSGIDGRELEYRVATRDEVSLKDAVIYPKEDGDRLLLYLAYPVEVGRGVSWTVFVDAITGQEIEVKQNFNT